MDTSRQFGKVESNSALHDLSVESTEASLALEIFACCRRGCASDDIYSKAIMSYDVFLRCLEKPDFALKIAGLANMHPIAVKECCIKIVDLLLFNGRRDPFLSLGLSKDVSKDETHRRWKRLLMLFHPDRAFAGVLDVKRTKTMNAAYQRIAEILAKPSPEIRDNNDSGLYTRSDKNEFDNMISLAAQMMAMAAKWGEKQVRRVFFEINRLMGGNRLHMRKDYAIDEIEYLRYVPSIIVLLTAFAAIVMFSLYILHSLITVIGRFGLG